MYWILGYCVLSWLIGWGYWTWISRFCGSEFNSEMAAVNPNRFFAVKFLSLLITPIVLPFAVAWFAWQFGFCLRNHLRIMSVGKKYREPTFQPIELRDLDEDIANFVDDATEPFLAFGFEVIGDFQTKSEPVPVYNRYLFGLGGTVLADVTTIFGVATRQEQRTRVLRWEVLPPSLQEPKPAVQAGATMFAETANRISTGFSDCQRLRSRRTSTVNKIRPA